MIGFRVISLLTFKDGVLHRTKKFRADYRYTLSQVDFWDADEAIILDITRGKRGSLQSVMDQVTDKAFVPIACGGGVSSWEDARRLFEMGADKIVINTAALDRPEFITELSKKIGNQSVLLSIDAKEGRVFADCGRRDTGRDPVEWAKEGVERGAGEILITSMERDGSLSGYDLDLCGSVADAVSVPVVFAGGAGNWSHFEQGIKHGASGVATSCIYHFTKNSLKSAKNYLSEKGLRVRL